VARQTLDTLRMERTTGSDTKSKIAVFINEWSTTVIPFANYAMSHDHAGSFNRHRGLSTAGVEAGQSGQLVLFAVEEKRDRLVLGL
jgi:hypothetical protein